MLNDPLTEHRKIVLCVDDAKENRGILNMVLMGAGYSFAGAASGEECLKIVSQSTPQLVLLDIEMPGLDGFETCRRLRQMPQMAKVPIAFLTVRKAGEDVKKGLASGGNDFIIKPFNNEKLLARVHHWVGQTKAAPQPPAQTTMDWDLSSSKA